VNQGRQGLARDGPCGHIFGVEGESEGRGDRLRWKATAAAVEGSDDGAGVRGCGTELGLWLRSDLGFGAKRGRNMRLVAAGGGERRLAEHLLEETSAVPPVDLDAGGCVLRSSTCR
jgi:hypothetical protein